MRCVFFIKKIKISSLFLLYDNELFAIGTQKYIHKTTSQAGWYLLNCRLFWGLNRKKNHVYYLFMCLLRLKKIGL